MFKIGDRVHYRQRTDHVRTVQYIHNDGHIDVVTDDGKTYHKMPQYSYVFISHAVDPTEEAVRLLEAAGFTVTPPKPKLTGRIKVIMTPSGNVHAFPEERKTEMIITEVLAIIDWTQGDGLETR